MGRYIAWTDVAGRYPSVATQGGDSAVGSYWLEKAEYEIDARLAPRYTVPFTPAHPVVQDLCIDLTYYKMTIGQDSSEPVKAYLDERIAALLNGTMLLTTSGAALAQGVVAWSQEAGHATSFGPGDPLDWEIDDDWIEAVQGQRDNL